MAKKATIMPISDQAVLKNLNAVIVARGISYGEIAKYIGHTGANKHGHFASYFNGKKTAGMRWSRFIEIVNAVRILSKAEIDFNELFKVD